MASRADQLASASIFRSSARRPNSRTIWFTIGALIIALSFVPRRGRPRGAVASLQPGGVGRHLDIFNTFSGGGTDA